MLSRHPSHSPLRRQLPLLPFRSCVRLGSTTESIARVQCNSIQGVKNSANKLLMKQCFTRAGVKTAEWWTIGKCYSGPEAAPIEELTVYNGATSYYCDNNKLWKNDPINLSRLPYPIISKSLYGSRGIGNTKHDTKVQLEQWMRGKNLNEYIFEKFQPLGREYRLHITQEGCFYTCRKLKRNDAPENAWQMHDDICSWALEENPSFKKPNNWQAIVDDCIRAQAALGLDICAFDVMVSPPKRDGNSEWLIVESCSAPSFGDITLQKYLIEIPKVLRRKYAFPN